MRWDPLGLLAGVRRRHGDLAQMWLSPYRVYLARSARAHGRFPVGSPGRLAVRLGDRVVPPRFHALRLPAFGHQIEAKSPASAPGGATSRPLWAFKTLLENRPGCRRLAEATRLPEIPRYVYPLEPPIRPVEPRLEGTSPVHGLVVVDEQAIPR